MEVHLGPPLPPPLPQLSRQPSGTGRNMNINERSAWPALAGAQHVFARGAASAIASTVLRCGLPPSCLDIRTHQISSPYPPKIRPEGRLSKIYTSNVTLVLLMFIRFEELKFF